MKKSGSLICLGTTVKECVGFKMGVNENQKYLGDGVYASFDGEHIWLAVNAPHNNVVALNHDVLMALLLYVTKIRQEPEEQVYSPYQEL